jgi:hypothetical protein
VPNPENIEVTVNLAQKKAKVDRGRVDIGDPGTMIRWNLNNRGKRYLRFDALYIDGRGYFFGDPPSDEGAVFTEVTVSASYIVTIDVKGDNANSEYPYTVVVKNTDNGDSYVAVFSILADDERPLGDGHPVIRNQ